jgi:hypothetical protein
MTDKYKDPKTRKTDAMHQPVNMGLGPMLSRRLQLSGIPGLRKKKTK